MDSSLIPWIPIPAAILLGVCCFSGSGLQSIFLTSIALISSTLLYKYSRQRLDPIEKESILRNEFETLAEPKYEIREEQEEDSLCGSECINPSSSTSEDSEVEWGNGEEEEEEDQSLDCSDDGSISDEESLIEIAIPTGHYVAYMKKKIPEFSPDSIFHRSNLMDLSTEINEEDNLIEIDISMGLIKCSRF